MKIADSVVVVTGGASGIGRALCRRMAAERARVVVVVDLDDSGATAVADEIGGLAIRADAASTTDLERVVATVAERFGSIDLFCANAGVFAEGGIEADEADWERLWNVNVLAIVRAAKTVLPGMIRRGSGSFLVTASAAGLLTQVGSAPYTVTKHAALALAEWLAITHGDDGIEVHCLCPQGVDTAMMREFEAHSAIGEYLRGVAVDPDDVAGDVIDALAAGTFLILPHPEVADYARRKAADPDRWLSGMRRFRAGLPAPEETP